MAEIDLAVTTQQRQEVAETMDAVAGAIISLNPVHRNFSGIYAAQIGKLRHKELLAPFGLDASDPGFWRRGMKMIEGFIDQLEKMN